METGNQAVKDTQILRSNSGHELKSMQQCHGFSHKTKQVVCHSGLRIISVITVVQCLYDQHILRGQKSSKVGMGIQQFRQVP